MCRSCREYLPWTSTVPQPGDSFDDIVCLWRYQGVVKSSLMKYKFYSRASYYRTYSEMLAERIRAEIFYDFQIAVCVPLHKKKHAERGYNQAWLICKQTADIIGVACSDKILERTRITQVQSLMPVHLRQQNVMNAFTVKNKDAVAGKNVLLFDDIITTGSTLNECASVLKQAGAVKVCAVTVASARRSIDRVKGASIYY